MVSERRVLHKQGPEGPTRHKRSRSRPQRKSFQTKHVPRLWKNGWQRSWTYEPYAVPLVAARRHPLRATSTPNCRYERSCATSAWQRILNGPVQKSQWLPRCDVLGALSMPSSQIALQRWPWVSQLWLHDTRKSTSAAHIATIPPSHHLTISNPTQPTEVLVVMPCHCCRRPKSQRFEVLWAFRASVFWLTPRTWGWWVYSSYWYGKPGEEFKPQ